jgi:hypothetical protein
MTEENLYEKKIIKMRKENNSYIVNILEEAIKWNPNLDEIVVLASVLKILDKNSLAVSRKEVLTAFNRYYSREFHGDKDSYLAWLYKAFNVKSGTKVQTGKMRMVPSKKVPPVVTTEEKRPINSLENKRVGLGCDNMPLKVDTTSKPPLKCHRTQSLSILSKDETLEEKDER